MFQFQLKDYITQERKDCFLDSFFVNFPNFNPWLGIFYFFNFLPFTDDFPPFECEKKNTKYVIIYGQNYF